MSLSGNGKCPDPGQWCGFDRSICDGTCEHKYIKDLEEELNILRDRIRKAEEAMKPVLECDARFGDLDEFDCCECKFCAVGDGGCLRGKAIGMQNAIQKARSIWYGVGGKVGSNGNC